MIIENLPAAEYHALGALSSSALTELARSPFHYWAKHLDTEREPTEPNEAMQLGSLIHTLTLESEEFPLRYLIIPEGAPKKPSKSQLEAKKPSEETKLSIAWWDEIRASAKGRELVALDEYRRASRIAARIRNAPAGELLFSEGGKPEVSLFWTDGETGVRCKCRIDWLSALPALIELKSTRDASPGRSFEYSVDQSSGEIIAVPVTGGFARQIINMGYHIRAAFYLMGVEACLGQTLPYIFAAVETESPFGVAFYEADSELLEVGKREARKLIRLYAECLEHDTWPGYPDVLLPISLPKWFVKRQGESV